MLALCEAACYVWLAKQQKNTGTVTHSSAERRAAHYGMSGRAVAQRGLLHDSYSGCGSGRADVINAGQRLTSQLCATVGIVLSRTALLLLLLILWKLLLACSSGLLLLLRWRYSVACTFTLTDAKEKKKKTS
jgi:hypothetical protein